MNTARCRDGARVAVAVALLFFVGVYLAPAAAPRGGSSGAPEEVARLLKLFKYLKTQVDQERTRLEGRQKALREQHDRLKEWERRLSQKAATERAALDKEVQAVAAQTTRLQARIKGHDALCRAEQAAVKAKAADYARALQDARALEKRLRDAAAQRAALQSAVAEANKQAQQLQARRTHLEGWAQKEREAIRQQAARLADEARRLQEQRAALERQAKAEQDALNRQIQAFNADARAAADRQKAARQRWADEQRALQAAVAAFNRDAQQLRERQQRLADRHRPQRAALQNRTAQLNAAIAAYKGRQQAYNDWARTTQERHIQPLIAAYKADAQRLQREHTALTALYASLRSEAAQRPQPRGLKGRIDAYKAAVASYNASLRGLMERKRTVSDAIARFNHEADARRRQLQSEADALQRQRQDLNRDIAALNDATRTDGQQVQQQAAELSRRKQQLDARIAAANRQAADANAEGQRLGTRQEGLKREIAATRSRLEGVRAKVEAAVRDHLRRRADLDQRVKAVNARVTEFGRDADAFRQRYQGPMRAAEEFNRQIGAAKGQFAEAAREAARRKRLLDEQVASARDKRKGREDDLRREADRLRQRREAVTAASARLRRELGPEISRFRAEVQQYQQKVREYQQGGKHLAQLNDRQRSVAQQLRGLRQVAGGNAPAGKPGTPRAGGTPGAAPAPPNIGAGGPELNGLKDALSAPALTPAEEKDLLGEALTMPAEAGVQGADGLAGGVKDWDGDPLALNVPNPTTGPVGGDDLALGPATVGPATPAAPRLAPKDPEEAFGLLLKGVGCLGSWHGIAACLADPSKLTCAFAVFGLAQCGYDLWTYLNNGLDGPAPTQPPIAPGR